MVGWVATAYWKDQKAGRNQKAKICLSQLRIATGPSRVAMRPDRRQPWRLMVVWEARDGVTFSYCRRAEVALYVLIYDIAYDAQNLFVANLVYISTSTFCIEP